MSNSDVVSVIIPTKNAGPDFLQLLTRLQNQQGIDKLEIIVIDSGSQDGTPQVAKEAGAQVVTIPSREFNHGHTRNQGITLSRGEWVALTVQDALPVDEYWLVNLIAPLRADPTIAGCYGLQIAPPDTSILAQARSRLWQHSHTDATIHWLDNPCAFHRMTPQEKLGLVGFDNVTACIRRSIWENYPFPAINFGEDTAWALRILQRGYKISFVPQAQVWHAHDRGLGYELRRAYVNGYTKVTLLDWPALNLSIKEALSLLIMLLRPPLLRKYPTLETTNSIRTRLQKELEASDSHAHLPYVYVYRKVLEFVWALVNETEEILRGEILSHTIWRELYSFATAVIVGEHLGATTAVKLRGVSRETFFWFSLKRILDQQL